MKTRFIVIPAGNPNVEAWRMPGPFIVFARHPAHAARLVRHKWPHYLTNHVSEEMYSLEVRGFSNPEAPAYVSDHRGRVIPSRGRVQGSLKNKTLVVDGVKWLVRQAISRAEADHAIAHARCRGSVGSLHITISHGVETITADVERV